MKNSVRRGLFHPDDIKTMGLAAAAGPAPLSAPLPGLVRKPSRPSINTFDNQYARGGSLASAPGGGSFGRNEAKKAQSQAEFGKYAEADEEDYEDVFGKVNATCESSPPYLRVKFGNCADMLSFDSHGAAATDAAVEYAAVGQIMGM